MFYVLRSTFYRLWAHGTSRDALKRVGGGGGGGVDDGGVDGIISLDRLGLEKGYVQAKRWQSTVGRPDVQGFYKCLKCLTIAADALPRDAAAVAL
jgi:restriction system protein